MKLRVFTRLELRNFTFLVMAFASVNLLAGCSSSAREPDSFPRNLEVVNNQIKNPSSETVILKGFNAFSPVWQAAGRDPHVGSFREDIFQEIKKWGANIVRLPVHPAVWQAEGTSFTFQILDRAIRWARKHELYVILDFHSIGYPPDDVFFNQHHDVYGEIYETNAKQIKSFWSTAARRYADSETVVFYEIFNEPVVSPNNYPAEITGEHWIRWRNFAEEVIDIIRRHDESTPVMVGGLRFGYDLSFVLKSPVRRDQVVYTTHPYPGKQWAVSWDEAFGTVSESYPVYVSEFGFSTTSPDKHFFEGNFKEDDKQYRNQIITYLNHKKIGWTAWSFSPIFEPALLKNEQFEPTESGRFYKKILMNN